MYTAILFAVGEDSSETFTLSREVSKDDKDHVLQYLLREANLTVDDINTILVFKNGKDAPECVHHWTSKDF